MIGSVFRVWLLLKDARREPALHLPQLLHSETASAGTRDFALLPGRISEHSVKRAASDSSLLSLAAAPSTVPSNC